MTLLKRMDGERRCVYRQVGGEHCLWYSLTDQSVAQGGGGGTVRTLALVTGRRCDLSACLAASAGAVCVKVAAAATQQLILCDSLLLP